MPIPPFSVGAGRWSAANSVFNSQDRAFDASEQARKDGHLTIQGIIRRLEALDFLATLCNLFRKPVVGYPSDEIEAERYTPEGTACGRRLRFSPRDCSGGHLDAPRRSIRAKTCASQPQGFLVGHSLLRTARYICVRFV